jgi:hypothetical protein
MRVHLRTDSVRSRQISRPHSRALLAYAEQARAPAGYKPVADLAGRIGDAVSLWRYAQVLRTLVHHTNPGQKVRTLMRLQRMYGNGFVQREVLALPREAIDGGGAAIHLWAHSLADVVQQKSETPGVQRLNGPPRQPKLLIDFGRKFPGAAALIRKSPEAMRLVRQAQAARVVFGGYAEHGPVKHAKAYTKGNKVYVPKARTDKVLAMGDFVFELKNAMNRPRSTALMGRAKRRQITAKQYAYKMVELEVEAMLQTGKIWFGMRRSFARGAGWRKYDKAFYLSAYKAFKAGRKTKHDLVWAALKRVYRGGLFIGWTVERYYMEQYRSL